MKYNLFLAWQSEKRDTQKYIQKGLRKAIKSLAEEEININLIDRPGNGESGSPNINELINEKLNDSDIFIADLTGVYSNEEDTKHISNPNVMYETGYSMVSLGKERCICLADTDKCSIEKLCFDINHDRISGFKSSANIERFSDNLVYYIKAAIESIGRRKYILNYLFSDVVQELQYLYQWSLRMYFQYDEEIVMINLNELTVVGITQKILSNKYNLFQICRNNRRSVNILKKAVRELHFMKGVNREALFKLTQVANMIEEINFINTESRLSYFSIDGISESTYITQLGRFTKLETLEAQKLMNKTVLKRYNTRFLLDFDNKNYIDVIDEENFESVLFKHIENTSGIEINERAGILGNEDHHLTSFKNVPVYKIENEEYAKHVANVLFTFWDVVKDVILLLNIYVDADEFNKGAFKGIVTFKQP